MANFVLIDHSLERVGGHHFEYDMHILGAAEGAGFEIVLATNQRFRNHKTLPTYWHVCPLFRDDMYCQHAVAGKSLGRRDRLEFLRSSKWFSGWYDAWLTADRQRRTGHFVQACNRLFHQVGLASGDHVFLASMSDFDLIGLVEYLKTDSNTQLADWHLQFHFSFLDGREPDYQEQQDRVDAMQRHFEKTLAQVPNHRLHFYNTTEQVTSQFNQMGAARFQTLPYPVSPTLQRRERTRSAEGPLRVTCAGHARDEKGGRCLSGLVRELWGEYFSQGKLQLLVQGSKRKIGSLLPSALDDDPQCERPAPEPVVFVRHPLPLDEYADYIRCADVGLFMYDSDRYYARCSGILVEMLSAGVPVIVPAGSSLAEPIAESIFQHLDELRETLPVVDCIVDATWQAPSTNADELQSDSELTIGTDRPTSSTEVAVPASASELLLVIEWIEPDEAGTYLHVETEQFDCDGHQLKRSTSIIGRRAAGGKTSALFHLDPASERIHLTLKNAYHGGQIVLNDMELVFLSAAEQPRGSCPAGKVGLIAADVDQFPALLRDIADHYDHYRATAEEFSVRWAQIHDPKNAVSILLASGRSSGSSDVESRAA